MIIKKLILHGYKRLFLNNIDHIEYTPESNIQIILGTNGSGKSSILSMLNPLPADLKKDFKEDGYKYIELEHRGSLYILSSGYTHKTKHSFLFNNTELNPGGTRTVQLELVYEHFKITNNINNILLGIDRFSIMPVSNRKYWFTELSTIDYSFSISLYNKLKQRHRDITGGIKLIQEEIVKAELNILTEEEIVKLEEISKYLEEYITYLVSLYDHTANSKSDVNILQTLEATNKEIIKLYTSTDISNYTIEEITTKITAVETQLAIITDKIKLIHTKLDTIDTNQQIIPIDTTIEAELSKCLANMETIKNTLFIDLNLDHIDNIINSFNLDYPDLVSLLNQLTEVSEVNTNQDNLNKLNDTIANNERLLANSKIKLDTYFIDKIALENHKHDDNLVTCTCGNSWYFKYDDNKHKQLTQSIEQVTTSISLLEKQLIEQTSLRNKILFKQDIFNKIKLLTLSRGELKPIWVYLFNKLDITKDSVGSFITELNKLQLAITTWSSYTDLNTRYKLLLDTIERNKAINVAVEAKSLDDLDKELLSLTGTKNKLSAELEMLVNIKNTLTKLEVIYIKLRTTLKVLNNTYRANVTLERNNILKELVTDLKTQMLSIDQSINTNRQNTFKLKSLTTQMEDYKSKEKVLNILVKELSPTEGLIAKSINSFLNIFINEMNHIINSIWSYNMELLPCEVSDDNDLDYKFRVHVDNSEIIEDISRLSSSMQEIVDLAFKIVFVKYMHIPDMPLILDEFGRTFDTGHRNTAYNVINTVITQNFDQVFMVSHFESMYGRFVNADITVLSSDNINIDPGTIYNKVMRLS